MKKTTNEYEHKYWPETVIGIDEAGRGPLAGPVAVGVAIVKKGKKPYILKVSCDSKKISALKRDSSSHARAQQL